MSLLNLIYELDAQQRHPHLFRRNPQTLDNHFGAGIREGHLEHVLREPNRLRQGRQEFERYVGSDAGTGPPVSMGPDGLQIHLDVQQFRPNELSVKVHEGSVVIEGKHEARDDDFGTIMRHFVRKYALDPELDSTKVTSTVSCDGILTVKVPRIRPTDDETPRVIEIIQTGPARDSITYTPQEMRNGTSPRRRVCNIDRL